MEFILTDLQQFIPVSYLEFLKKVNRKKYEPWVIFKSYEIEEITLLDETYVVLAVLFNTAILTKKSRYDDSLYIADAIEEAIVLLDEPLEEFLPEEIKNYTVRIWLEKLYSVFEIVARLFAAGLLFFFAYAPGWLGFQFMMGSIMNPIPENILIGLPVAGLLYGIAYFIALIGWRALTGRGRKEDGALMPPWAMKSIIMAFGVTAILIVILGVMEGKIVTILGGIAYIAASIKALSIVLKRTKGLKA